MKKSSLKPMFIISGIILAAVIIGMISIRSKRVDTDITSKTTRVGLIITGVTDDENYCQAHFDALMRIKDELNLEIICREGTSEEKEDYTRSARELIEDEGCRIIIGASYGYYLSELAEEYPDVCFLHMMGTEARKNLSSSTGRMYQARYLSGIVAGMRTRTGVIGYMAAFPFSEVIRQINAFTLGVRSVAPDARVYVRYCNSWLEDEPAGEACKKLLDAHPDIDVFSMHTNSLEPNRIAEERGIWAVGYNRDDRELFPGSYLTACEWRWDNYYKEAITAFLQGKFRGEITWLGLESGIMGLSPLTENAAPGSGEAVESAREKLLGRRFDVFYGPVTDNEGRLRIPAGEAMSDDEMLNNFLWYVEGVEVEE